MAYHGGVRSLSWAALGLLSGCHWLFGVDANRLPADAPLGDARSPDAALPFGPGTWMVEPQPVITGSSLEDPAASPITEDGQSRWRIVYQQTGTAPREASVDDVATFAPFAGTTGIAFTPTTADTGTTVRLVADGTVWFSVATATDGRQVNESVFRDGRWEPGASPPNVNTIDDERWYMRRPSCAMFVRSSGGNINSSQLFELQGEAPREVIELNTDTLESSPWLSPDCRQVYFTRTTDSVDKIFYAQRNSVSDNWGPPTLVDSLSHPESTSDIWVSDDLRVALFRRGVGKAAQLYRAHRTD